MLTPPQLELLLHAAYTMPLHGVPDVYGERQYLFIWERVLGIACTDGTTEWQRPMRFPAFTRCMLCGTVERNAYNATTPVLRACPHCGPEHIGGVSQAAEINNGLTYAVERLWRCLTYEQVSHFNILAERLCSAQAKHLLEKTNHDS